MSNWQKWFWEAYLTLILIVAAEEVYLLLQPYSQIRLYFAILTSFDPVYNFSFGAYIVQVILTAAHCLPLALYIFEVHVLNQKIWKVLFVLRCVFEVLGRSYDVHYYTAQYYESPFFFGLTVLFDLAILIPSYYACYQYAFKPWPQRR